MKKIIFFITLLFLNSCSSYHKPSSYMAFDNIEYIDKFPFTFSLSNEKVVDWDVIGMKKFRIYDSLLVVSTTDRDGFWSFYDIKDLSFKGKFIKAGQGPNEFALAPDVNASRFYKENNQLFIDIYDFQTGKIYKMNVNQSLNKKELSISIKRDSLPSFIFDFAVIKDNKYYCREINKDQTQQIRYLRNNGIKEIPNTFKILNQASVEKGKDFNLLSTITKISPKGDVIVEAPIYLHQINLYSSEGKWGKTICVGKKLDNIENLQDQIDWTRIYTHGGVCTYDDLFAILFVNEDIKTMQTKRKTLPIIQLFNWKGEPLAELKMNRFIAAFDIDFANGYLYALDIDDILCKYDIHAILNKIKQK
ncbi:MAG: hypothetical protein PHG06_07000 [Parabacteroides sp.]|nr:hypothetical protein [Parabacteroides sp.]